jgi:2-(1,2-epoxy-1,2-dihydrophenyl)acetyl-CoA isomerase
VGKIDLERSLREDYTPMLTAFAESPIPTISAVNGPAAGAGANLALSADVVIAADTAYFVQAFTRIGLMPDAGGTFTLPRSIGMAKAMGAALFAEKITAQQAEAWGMIWEAAEPDKFDALWKQRATHLANGPTVAYQHTKTALRKSLYNSYGQQLMLEAKLQGKCGKTRDFKEGVLSFLQKRLPNFEGR